MGRKKKTFPATGPGPPKLLLKGGKIYANIWYVTERTEGKEVRKMRRSLSRVLSLALTVCMLLSLLAIPAAAYTGSLDNFRRSTAYTPGQFSDVDDNKWYGDNQTQAVRLACELGFMSGTGGGGFSPEGSLTLAEAITMAVRARRTYTGCADNTLPAGDPWYAPYVEYAIANGIIFDGDFDDYTRPATRGEMAYIFYSVVSYENLAAIRSVKTLPDVGYDTPHSAYILTLYEAGVLSGNDAYGTFTPDAPIQRAAAAAILSRIALPSQRSQAEIQTPPEATEPGVQGRSWSEYYTYGMELTRNNMDELARTAFYSLANDFTVKTRLDLQSTLSELQQKYCPYAPSMNWTYWSEGPYTWATVTITYSVFAQLMAHRANPTGVAATSEALAYDAKADALLGSIVSGGMTDYQKAKAIHDYMVSHYRYDETYSDASYSFTGLLDYGTGVCQAYAELYELLMDKCGIDSYIIVGYAGESHSWNIIKLDGDWYHVDCTWDDPVPDRPGTVRWDYFCISDTEMVRDHSWDGSSWPACNGVRY